MGLLTPSSNPHRTRIKICGLTRADDIQAAVQAGVDAIGFVFYKPSPRYIDPGQAARLMLRIPPQIDIVGLVVNPSAAELRAIETLAKVNLWQFHGDEDPVQCARLALDKPWLKAARIGEVFPFDDFSLQYRYASGLLLDALVEGYGGGGVPFNWNLIPQTWVNANAHRVVLSGGLNAHNVGEAIARLHPQAVDVSSSVEVSKGVKDPALIDAFVKAVHAADAAYL
jgi:phosphoribosylanthranilate isomerase